MRLRGSGIPVPQDRVVQPVGQRGVAGQELPDTAQDTFEVVLLPVPPKEHVERGVHVLATWVLLQPLHVDVVLGRIKLHDQLPARPLRSRRALLRARAEVVELLTLFILQTDHLAASDVLEAVLPKDAQAVPLRGRRGRVGGVRLAPWAQRQEEEHIVLADLVPLFEDGLPAGEAGQVIVHLGNHAGGPLLTQVRPAHVGHHEARDGQRHLCPALEAHRARLQPAGAEPPQGVVDILPDLVGGLQLEQVEVPNQVVLLGQKLEVQLGQRDRTLAPPRPPRPRPLPLQLRHPAGVPHHTFGGVQGQGADPLPPRGRRPEGAGQRGLCQATAARGSHVRRREAELLRAELKEVLVGQRLKVLQQRARLGEGPAAGVSEPVQLRPAAEGEPLGLLQGVVVPGLQLLVPQGRARLAVDPDVHVLLGNFGQAHEVLVLRKATFGAEIEPREESLVQQVRAHEFPRRELREEIPHELQGPLAELWGNRAPFR